MRGIGVAVMCSACGASPSGALASSAARWRTPKRCCSSTTASAERAELDGRLDQRVRADDQRQLARGEPAEELRRRARGRRAGQQRDRHEPAEQPVERGHVLLGERLGRRHQRGLARRSRPRAASRAARRRSCPTADLAHQQPLHRASRPRGRASIRSNAVAGRRSASNGSVASHGSDELAGASSSRARAPSARARLRAASASSSSSSSSNASRWRALVGVVRLVGEVDRRERGRPVGQPLGGAQPRRAAARRRRGCGRALPGQLADPLGRDPLGGRVDRHEAERVDAGAPPRADHLVLAHAELVAVPELAVQQERRCPPPSWRANHGWLNQTATIGPVSSATRASTRFRRRWRIGRTLTLRTVDRDRRVLAQAERPDRARLAPVGVRARQVLEQVADRLDAERRPRPSPPARSAAAARPGATAAAASAAARRSSSAVSSSVAAKRSAMRERMPARVDGRAHSAQSSHHQAAWPPSW